MKHSLPLLMLTGLLFGQDLHFKNNNETIKIETGEKLQINDNKYTLLSTDYSKQYLLVKKHNYAQRVLDTLSFDSVVSFKYYEKSLRSFTSSVVKGTIPFALIGGVISYFYEDGNTMMAFAGGLFFGCIGAFGGAVHGILIPRASEEIILDKEGWYISK